MPGFIGGDPYKSPTFGKSLSLRVDGGFNAVSINPSGRDVVLASRTGLYIIDLDDPFSEPRWLHHITSWEVADVQWCPNPARHSWVISTSNQKAIVWNLSRSSSKAVEHVLHGHFRAITDINFHPIHSEILATCSIDTYVLAWDMRSPKKPYYQTSNWRSGASQVKWNYQNPNILASSHANDVFIWDIRKGTNPLSVLRGHVGSVNSIDFNRFNEAEIMSSSNDGTVKFWDINKTGDELQKTILTDFPVWRGRYLPFGEGYCIMPMVGGNNSIFLAGRLDDMEDPENKTSRLQPTYVFKGHTDRVTDFLWRTRHGYNTSVDDREFQLVTWSKDCDLKLWQTPDIVYEKAFYECGKQLNDKLVDYDYSTFRNEPHKSSLEQKSSNIHVPKETFVTKSGLKNYKRENQIDQLQWVSGVRMHNNTSDQDFFEESRINNLGEEVSAVGHKFPRIIFERISVSTGELVLTLSGPWVEEDPDKYIFMRIVINFPHDYPSKGNQPIFKIEENRELHEESRREITESLKEITKRYTDLNRYCLEPCLQYLLGEKVNLDISHLEEENERLFSFDFAEQHSVHGSHTGSSDEQSEIETEISSISEDQEASEFGGSIEVFSGPYEPKFDSTPVPNGCGAVWTPSGELVCFFMNGNKSERKQQSILNIGQTGFGGLMKSKNSNGPEALYDETESKANAKRPKTYQETLSAYSQHASESANQSSDSDSDDSDDSYNDYWDDILKNDITLRTRMPMLPKVYETATRSNASASGKTSDSVKKGKCTIFIKDFSHLIPDKKALAEEYILFGESSEAVAKYNATVAEKYGYDDIAQCWRMIADVLIGRAEGNYYNYSWDQHELGGKLFIKRVFEYFEKCKNVQMLAMLSCILVSLGRPPSAKDLRNTAQNEQNHTTVTFYNNNYSSSPFYQSTANSHFSGDAPIQKVRLRQGNNPASLHDGSSMLHDDYFGQNHDSHTGKNFKTHSMLNTGYSEAAAMIPDVNIQIIHDDVLDLALLPRAPSLLEPETEVKCRKYRLQYAEMLYIWQLPLDRAEMLKFNVNCNTDSEYLKAIEQETSLDIYKGIKNVWLDTKDVELHNHNCCYCGLKVKSQVFVCGNCQHVTHRACAEIWWENGDECPSGCGCKCIEYFAVD